MAGAREIISIGIVLILCFIMPPLHVLSWTFDNF